MPTFSRSRGKTTTPSQPTAIPITAATHLGAPAHTNWITIAENEPLQAMASTVIRQSPASTNNPNGMRDLYELGDIPRAEYLGKREAIQGELAQLVPAAGRSFTRRASALRLQ